MPNSISSALPPGIILNSTMQQSGITANNVTNEPGRVGKAEIEKNLNPTQNSEKEKGKKLSLYEIPSNILRKIFYRYNENPIPEKLSDEEMHIIITILDKSSLGNITSELTKNSRVKGLRDEKIYKENYKLFLELINNKNQYIDGKENKLFVIVWDFCAAQTGLVAGEDRENVLDFLMICPDLFNYISVNFNNSPILKEKLYKTLLEILAESPVYVSVRLETPDLLKIPQTVTSEPPIVAPVLTLADYEPKHQILSVESLEEIMRDDRAGNIQYQNFITFIENLCPTDYHTHRKKLKSFVKKEFCTRIFTIITENLIKNSEMTSGFKNIIEENLSESQKVIISVLKRDALPFFNQFTEKESENSPFISVKSAEYISDKSSEYYELIRNIKRKMIDLHLSYIVADKKLRDPEKPIQAAPFSQILKDVYLGHDLSNEQMKKIVDNLLEVIPKRNDLQNTKDILNNAVEVNKNFAGFLNLMEEASKLDQAKRKEALNNYAHEFCKHPIYDEQPVDSRLVSRIVDLLTKYYDLFDYIDIHYKHSADDLKKELFKDFYKSYKLFTQFFLLIKNPPSIVGRHIEAYHSFGRDFCRDRSSGIADFLSKKRKKYIQMLTTGEVITITMCQALYEELSIMGNRTS